MKQLPQVPIKTEFLKFSGGFDTVTPPLEIPAGYCREAQNYEQDVNGGYRRLVGYERFSGKDKPSDAAYAVLTCTITGTVVVGDVLTDNATTSFGTVIALPSGQAILTLITGTFSTGNIRVGGVVVGTCVGAQVTDGASTALLHAQYKNLAADVYRALIAAVTGSGDILGVWVYNDVVYAFRNNAGGTAEAMYKSTASGWSLVALGEEVSFSNANTSVEEGDTLTQGAVTATITRVVVQTGTLVSGVNTGRLIFASHAGGNFAAGAATSTGGGALTLSGAQTAITFTNPNGRFEFVNHNFGGSPNTLRMYGCDGVNRAFEFDGTVFVPIATGMTTDQPQHIATHKNHLFISYIGSVQHSSPADQYRWSVVVGAAEIAMGEQITGFMVQPGGANESALAVFTRNNISILYGSSVADWKLTPFNKDAGGIAHSLQFVGNTTIMFDDRGLSSLQTAEAYGNFSAATLSKQVQTWLNDRRTLISASCVNRDKTQYRLFFSDKSALYVTFDNGQVIGMMPQLFVDEVTCACSREMADGTEVSFFGSSDGVVYQLEKGTSFDGDAIEARLYLMFNHSGTPRVQKRYRKAMFEITGDGYAELSASYELGYAATTIEQPGSETLSVDLTPAYWDTAYFDSFIWDGVSLTPSEMDMVGTAENMSLKISSNSDYFAATRLSGAVIHYSPRRQLR